MASLRMEARIKQPDLMMKLSNLLYRGVTPFGPLLWQAEADTELTLSASPTTTVGQKALALAKRRYSTVTLLTRKFQSIFKSNTNRH